MLDEGQRAVLLEMSGDATPQAWASVLGCRVVEVLDFCRAEGLPIRSTGWERDRREQRLIEAIDEAYACAA